MLNKFHLPHSADNSRVVHTSALHMKTEYLPLLRIEYGRRHSHSHTALVSNEFEIDVTLRLRRHRLLFLIYFMVFNTLRL